jgi:23S rRNA (uracil1939-C5)-methyltransferase
MYFCHILKNHYNRKNVARKKSKDKKDRIVENVKITGIADKGKSVGRDAEGQVVFVENAAPGDVVDVRIYRQKNGFLEGIPTKFHSLSADRTEPFCAHFDLCGGCKWQHITYESQLFHKQVQVENAFKHLAKVPVETFEPILPCLNNTYYRNKVEYTFSNKRWLTADEIYKGVSNYEDVLGFHRPGAFDKILDVKKCYLQEDPSNLIRNGVKKLALEQGLTFYDMKELKGFMRHIMIKLTTKGEIMLIISFFYDDKEQIGILLPKIMAEFPQVTTLIYCINSKLNDFVLDLPMIVYYGKGYIEENLGAVNFKIGPKSFFQTNTKQAERLFDTVVDFCEFDGSENVYDLYTGIGSIALYIANKVKQVVGIEEVAPAIEDAVENAARNNIFNTIFYTGDVKNILTTSFAKKHGKPDVLITDPPRAGMHQTVVNMLLQLEAPRLVYVSCNPATQARDIAMLYDKYDVVKVRPVDMFPHTHHVENVALLKLRNA